jgi:hypothetical protein
MKRRTKSRPSVQNARQRDMKTIPKDTGPRVNQRRLARRI